MSFEPVYVRVLWCVVVIAAVEGVLRFLYIQDEDMHNFKWRIWRLCGAVTAMLCSFFLYPGEDGEVFGLVGFFCINLYLAAGVAMDILLKQVTDLVQYGGLVGGGILILQMSPPPEICKELILYTFIQYCVFRKMYGRADVIGFVLCALFLAATGKGIGVYVGHMSLSFGMLAMVQAFRRNIASNGNLKQPVALFPYIMCGFLLII